MTDRIEHGVIDIDISGVSFSVGLWTQDGKRKIALSVNHPISGAKGYPITKRIALQLIDGLQRATQFVED